MCLFLGFAAGHYVSPWLDEKLADLYEWWSPDPSDDRNVNRNDWTLYEKPIRASQPRKHEPSEAGADLSRQGEPLP